MSTDLIATCNDSIATIETGLASKDEVLQAIDFVTRLGEVAREFKAKVEAATILYIKEHGEINIGTRRFWVAPNKTTKCKDVRKTIEAVLEVTGGDFDKLTECLSSNALKPAATKKVLAERADEFFETKETDSLKKEGEKPAERLQSADSRFTNKAIEAGDAE